LNAAAKNLVYLPLIAIMVYFGSGLELYLNFATGILPLYGQLAGLGVMLAWIVSWALITNGRSLGVPRVVAGIYALLLLFCFVNAISFIYSPQSDPVVDALVARVKAAIFMIAFSLIMLDPDFRKKFAYGAAFLAILGSALCLFDFVSPTFSTVPGRGASLYLNSNETAILLVSFGIIASSRLRVTANYLLWIIVSLGVIVTFSRTGWGLLMLALFGLSVIGKFGGGRGRFVLLGLVIVLIGGVLAAYVSGDLYVWLSRSTFAQYLDPNTLARLGSQGAAIDDYSSLEREDVFWFGVHKFLESPFIGWGVGYGYVWAEAVNTHNMPLALAVDLGAIGPIMYFGLFATLVLRTRGAARLLSLVSMLAGLTSHNQLEFLADALAIAFAIASTEETSTPAVVDARRPRGFGARPPR
jgi:O-antigen ligase